MIDGQKGVCISIFRKTGSICGSVSCGSHINGGGVGGFKDALDTARKEISIVEDAESAPRAHSSLGSAHPPVLGLLYGRSLIAIVGTHHSHFTKEHAEDCGG